MYPAESSLDPIEIPVSDETASLPEADPPADWTLPQPFKHSGWQTYRKLIYRAICETETSRSRSKRFARCGANVWILRNREDPDRYKAVLSCCHDRFCTPCARARAAAIRCNLGEHTAGMQLRFLTLTVAHVDRPLPDQLDRLYRAFKLLRGRPLWRSRVRGGVAFLEVKKSERTGCWHPHLHVLLDSDYLPQQDLANLWLEATGDSKIVDIRLVRRPEEVQQYVTKYVTKPVPARLIRDQAALVEVVQALKDRRMFIAFGGWRSWKLTVQATATGWELYATEHKIWERVRNGDEHANRIIEAVEAFLYGDADAEFYVPSEPITRGPPAGGGTSQALLWQ